MEKIDSTKKYGLDEAIDFVKNGKKRNFDETIEVHLRLIVPSSVKSFTGKVLLPAGLAKKRKIAVFVCQKKIDEAKKAGADLVGAEDLIEKIKNTGKVDFDVAVAEPAMMPKLLKIAKILGPKGLMPNPKTATITEDITLTIKNLRKGEVYYKMDKSGNLHQAIAKVSWDKEKIIENFKAFLQSVKKSKPSGAKPNFIKRITICSSMGLGIKIESGDL